MPKSKIRAAARARRLAAEQKFNARIDAAFADFEHHCPECNPGVDQVLNADEPRTSVRWL